MWGMRVSGGSAFSTNHFHFNQVKLVGENDHTITLTSCNNSFQDYNISDYENYLYTENTTSITGLYKDSYFYLFASRPFTLNVYSRPPSIQLINNKHQDEINEICKPSSPSLR